MSLKFFSNMLYYYNYLIGKISCCAKTVNFLVLQFRNIKSCRTLNSYGLVILSQIIECGLYDQSFYDQIYDMLTT